MQGRERLVNAVGFIPESLDPVTKTTKYVELLTSDDDDKVLMGEPAHFTTPHYPYFMHVYSEDLEHFAAFCGLGLLCKNKHSDLVGKAMLASPKSLDVLCKWTYKTPYIGSNQEPRDYKRSDVQKNPEYAIIMHEGPLNLLMFLCGAAGNISSDLRDKIQIRIASGKHFEGFMKRLTELAARTTKSMEIPQRASVHIIRHLVEAAPAKSLIEVNKNATFISAMEKGDFLARDLYELITKGDNSSTTAPTADTNNTTTTAQKATTCYQCGNGGKLRQCGACRKVSYCSVECQKADWPIHKKLCKGKN